MSCSFEQLRASICRCKVAVDSVLSLWERFKRYIGKDLHEINDDLVYKSLIAGLREDGTFTELSVAKFVEELIGVKIDDPKGVAAALSIGIRPSAKVSSNYAALLLLLEVVAKASRQVLEQLATKLGGCDHAEFSVTSPRDVQKPFAEFLDCAFEFLPQYNQCVQLAFHTAQLTYRYLKALSQQKGSIFYDLLENKKLIDALGLAEISNLGIGKDFELWGYPDCLVFDKNRLLRCFDIERIETIGGALNRLALFSKIIIENTHSIWKRWFEISIDIANVERDYVSKLIKEVEKSQLERNYVIQLLNKETRRENIWGPIVVSILFGFHGQIVVNEYYYSYSCRTADVLHRLITGKGAYMSHSGKYILDNYSYKWGFEWIYGECFVPLINIDQNGIIRFDREEFSLNPIDIRRFLATVEPYMFLRVINPVFIYEDGRVAYVFLTASYSLSLLKEHFK